MTERTTFHLDRLRGRAVVRDPREHHRVSTPLELFFDLTFVVAVGRASAALHHELAAGDVRRALWGFLATFFAVWWAWMNFTWFASAHDSDDVAFRLLAFVQMAGVLVLASGVTRVVEHGDLTVCTVGYAIMRLGYVGGWLRVARDEPAMRRRALRFVGAVSVLQIVWLLRLALSGTAGAIGFAVLILVELAIPLWAGRVVDETPFHPHHIEERYSLFTILVLGEAILAATAGFQGALDERGLTTELLAVGLGGLVLAFTAWWIYFDHPGHLTPTPTNAYRWGYGHVVVFGSLAALGAGIQVAIEALAGHAPERTAALAVALPISAYQLGLALIMVMNGSRPTDGRVWPKIAGAAAMVLVGVVASVPVAVVGCAVVMTVLAATMILSSPPPLPVLEPEIGNG
ncbi:MAG: low temperature requirement protein A [Actinobacteria bacterium]|nr:low temperature requirement protein A [Actinomycetota bacterium]